jgi:hypothetical protein
MNKVQYLGHIVDEHGAHVDPTKIQVIRLAIPEHTNQASKFLRTFQLLSQVRVGILSYCMGPQPSNQGWWQGKVLMGEFTKASVR